MGKIVYALFFIVFFADFLSKNGMLPRYATWSLELVLGGVALMVLFGVAAQRAIAIPLKYIVFLVLIIALVAIGVVINDVPPGALFAGIRNYFKFIPLFMLPALMRPSERQVRNQLLVLLGIGLVQFPVAVYQRVIEGAGMQTGDVVRGTLGTSSYLSIFLICSVSVLVAFYVKGFLSRRLFAILLVALFVPTTINETKGTMFLLPVAVGVPVLMLGGVVDKVRQSGKMLFLLAGLLVVFVGVEVKMYQTYWGEPAGQAISRLDFFTEGGRFNKYLAPKLSGVDDDRLGRVDVLIAPYEDFAGEPLKLLVGLGIGNVSESFLGPAFSGKYVGKYGDLMFLGATSITLELGVIGLVLVLLTWWNIFYDALRIKERGGVAGALAVGWAGVIGILFLSLMYKNVVYQDAVSCLFWYWSGYIVFVYEQSRQGARARGSVRTT
jgi:hypothetical protein